MLPAPRKVTCLESAMNRVVVAVLVALGTAALCLATANMVWEGRHSYRRHWYLGWQVSPVCCQDCFQKQQVAGCCRR
jgi:hypothetical protein